jgi:hypothetical protein
LVLGDDDNDDYDHHHAAAAAAAAGKRGLELDAKLGLGSSSTLQLRSVSDFPCTTTAPSYPLPWAPPRRTLQQRSSAMHFTNSAFGIITTEDEIVTT